MSREAVKRTKKCDHHRTETFEEPPTETESGIALDGEQQLCCADCRRVLEVLA